MEQIDIVRFENIKTHIQKHKREYICFGIGIAIGVILFGKRRIEIAPIMNNTMVNNNVINNAGRLHKITKRIKPDGSIDIWESLGEGAKEIAEEYGITPNSMRQNMSRVANGHIPDFRGDRFQFIGTGTR